jgi:hypothetical protein
MAKAKSRTTPNRSPRHLTLSQAQIEALEEMCVLSAYSMGFTYSPAMDRLCKAIADKAGPAARADYFARASKRERVELRA